MRGLRIFKKSPLRITVFAFYESEGAGLMNIHLVGWVVRLQMLAFGEPLYGYYRVHFELVEFQSIEISCLELHSSRLAGSGTVQVACQDGCSCNVRDSNLTASRELSRQPRGEILRCCVSRCSQLVRVLRGASMT